MFISNVTDLNYRIEFVGTLELVMLERLIYLLFKDVDIDAGL